MLNSIGTTEWIVIALVVVLVFGSKKLPDLFKALGKAVNEFKKAAQGTDESAKK